MSQFLILEFDTLVSIQIRKRALEGFNGLSRKLQIKADEIIQRLPSEHTLGKSLEGPFKGLRNIWITKKFRIIYCHCEDCRNNGWVSYNLNKRCENCDDYPPDTLHIIRIGPRGGMYDEVF